MIGPFAVRVSRPARLLLTLVAFAAFTLGGSPALAQSPHQLCDPAETDCRDILISHIRAETVRLDVAFWFMEDAWMASEVIARWRAGVPVRILMDTEANGPNPLNAQRLAEFQNAGIPMRERTASGILHWKMMIFAGQGIVEFSGANYSSDAWLPQTPTDYENYIDEVITFTSDPALVDSFKTKYDDLWTNTTTYTNYRNVSGPLTRAYATYPIDPQLNFVPDESHYTRAAADFRREPSAIDVIMYRITDYRFADEMIQAKRRGVPVRLLTEPLQYRDVRRLWHSYNVDLLYMNGIEIRHRTHAGLNHQKTVLLRGLNTAIFGSSNWSSASADYQEEHNLFTDDATIYQWLVNQFERKWNNLTGVSEYGPFVPLPPDQATSPSPTAGATNVPTQNAILAWDAGPWAHRYDVYLGTNGNAMNLIATDVYLGPSQSVGDFKSVVVPGALQPGTTYYWRIVSRTMANKEALSPLWTFTTAGDTPPPTPYTIVRQPYLQQVTSTAATVVWATRESGTAQVRITSPAGLTTTVSAASALVPASATGLSGDYYQHVAQVGGLTSATSYQYDILLNGSDLTPGTDTVRTAPAVGTGTVSFIAFGDSGTGSAEQQQLAALMASDTFDFAVHGGDVAYGVAAGTGAATYQTMDDWFFAPYGSWLRARPMFPSLGNHDSRAANGDGRPYLDLFVLPTNGASASYPDHAERFYSFDYGPVHVVVLDTELAFQDVNRRAAQLAWLDADLSATTQPWKVAVFHRSPYSSGGEHGSDLAVREAFGAAFDRHGVQLAISAHEHDYERTVPMRAGAPDAEGTTYIVTGGGGGPLYPSGTATWTAYSASVHHYLKGTVSDCTLQVDAVSISGGALDRVTLSRCEAEPPLPLPWTSRDIGAVGPAGDAVFSNGTFTVRGGGADIWNAADAFHFVSQPVSGDVDVVARVASVEYVANWVKAGVMIRDQLTPDSQHGLMLVSAGKGLAFQRRTATGGVSTSTSGGAGVAPGWVKLERRGNTITAFRSADGANWMLVGSDTFSMGETVQVGLAVSSHDATRLASATFDNVTVTPVGETPPNDPPTVVLTTPVTGATFTAPATIALAASATDEDGTVTRVDFYAGASLLASDTAAPFEFVWSNVPAGSYAISARATDDDGAVTTSAIASITVEAPPANTPPSITLTSPSDGATFTAPAAVTLTVSAFDSDGTITRVEFFAGATLLATTTADPHRFRWENIPAGAYTLTARATDDDGATTTSAAVSITVNEPAPPGVPPPWTAQDIGAVGVAGSAAEAGGTFTVRGAGADIWNSADAFHYVWQPLNGDADVIARVASVEYVANWVKAGVMIRQALTPDSPHALMLVSAGKGLAFQRRVATGGGSTSTSGGAGTAPAWVKLQRRGATITAYRSADGVSWTLVGSDTFTMPTNVYVGLAVSSHDATRVATVTFDNVSVMPVGAPPPNQPPTVNLTSPAAGATFTAPATINIAAAASDPDGTVTRVDFYADGTLLGSAATAPYQWSWTNVPIGTYSLTARAVDDDGATTTSAAVSVTVNAAEPPSGVPSPWVSQDIGAVGPAGSATYASGTFTVKGAGGDIWYAADAFHYVWQPISGDVDIVARVASTEYVHAWVKGAVMIREQLTASSAHAMMLVSPGKGLAFQRRVATAGESTNTSGGAGTAPAWVKLERRGNTIRAYRSADGVAWTLVGSDTFTMTSAVYVGLAVTSHDATRLATVTFDNVSVIPR